MNINWCNQSPSCCFSNFPHYRAAVWMLWHAEHQKDFNISVRWLVSCMKLNVYEIPPAVIFSCALLLLWYKPWYIHKEGFFALCMLDGLSATTCLDFIRPLSCSCKSGGIISQRPDEARRSVLSREERLCWTEPMLTFPLNGHQPT